MVFGCTIKIAMITIDYVGFHIKPNKVQMPINPYQEGEGEHF